jgi:hypothetical protein
MDLDWADARLLVAAPDTTSFALPLHPRATFGASERQLHRRFVARIVEDRLRTQGVAGVLRLRHFLAGAARAPRVGLAALAAEAGSADQAHLSRDCLRLTGLPGAGS